MKGDSSSSPSALADAPAQGTPAATRGEGGRRGGAAPTAGALTFGGRQAGGNGDALEEHPYIDTGGSSLRDTPSAEGLRHGGHAAGATATDAQGAPATLAQDGEWPAAVAVAAAVARMAGATVADDQWEALAAVAVAAWQAVPLQARSHPRGMTPHRLTELAAESAATIDAGLLGEPQASSNGGPSHDKVGTWGSPAAPSPT